MKIKVLLIATLMLASFQACKKHNLKGEDVSYTVDGMTMKGYVVYDASVQGPRPGVLVVHEWWGQNEYARHRADMLAELGYTALALDMYGEGRHAHHPDEAGKMSGEVFKNFETAKARFNAALDLLKKNPNVIPEKVAAVGYCFGGAIVLNMARQGIPLRGVVSFHGNYAAVKPAEKGTVTAKMLVLHGADDKFSSQQQIDDFKKEMADAGVDMRFISYPGAMHAFSNPEADKLGQEFHIPLAYNADADKKSWDEMKKFLTEIFAM